ncbi:ELMO/CED-12 family-domain-containing protein [Lipomyces tetrasporus]
MAYYISEYVPYYLQPYASRGVKFCVLFAQALGDSITTSLLTRKRDLEADKIPSPISSPVKFLSPSTSTTNLRLLHQQHQQHQQQDMSLWYQIKLFWTVIWLSGYKAVKLLIRKLLGTSALYRICRLGLSEDARARQPDAAPYHRLLSRRAVWLLDSEMILSDQLIDEKRAIQQYAVSPAMMELDEMAKTIAVSTCRVKNMDVAKPTAVYLEKALAQVLLVERFVVDVVDLCGEKVEWDRSSTQLIELWAVLHSHRYWPESANYAAVSRESRAGNNWCTIGFQGLDPCTDFRGTGKMGLLFFHQMCMLHPGRTVRIILESRSPDIHLDTAHTPYYPAALASIHVSRLISRLLYAGDLRLWLLTSMDPNSKMQDLWDLLTHLHCYMWIEYHKFWRHQVRKGIVSTVMDFEKCFELFKHKMTGAVKRRPLMWTSIYPTLANLPQYYYRWMFPQDYFFANLPYGKAEFEKYFDAVEVEDERVELEKARGMMARSWDDDASETTFVDEYELDDMGEKRSLRIRKGKSY